MCNFELGDEQNCPKNGQKYGVSFILTCDSGQEASKNEKPS